MLFFNIGDQKGWVEKRPNWENKRAKANNNKRPSYNKLDFNIYFKPNYQDPFQAQKYKRSPLLTNSRKRNHNFSIKIMQENATILAPFKHYLR